MAIKRFSQTDPQWKSRVLGFDKTSTIRDFGCLLTKYTICATYYGETDITPVLLNAVSILDELQPLILRMPKGTELLPINSQATAARKVGQSGKWLRVKDAKDNKGCMAAWLLKERPEDLLPQAIPNDC